MHSPYFFSFLNRVVKWSKHYPRIAVKNKKYRVPRVNFIETQRYFIRPLPVQCLKMSINENAIHFTCTHCLEPRVSGRSIECACTRSPAFPSLSTYQRNQKVLRHSSVGGYFILHPDFSRKRRRIRAANPLTSLYFSGRWVNLLKIDIHSFISIFTCFFPSCIFLMLLNLFHDCRTIIHTVDM